LMQGYSEPSPDNRWRQEFPPEKHGRFRSRHSIRIFGWKRTNYALRTS